MVIPTAAAFYCPEKAKTKTRDQEATIRNIHNHLEPGVVAVNAFSALKTHAAENIYLRTDHHWAASVSVRHSASRKSSAASGGIFSYTVWGFSAVRSKEKTAMRKKVPLME